MVCPIEEQAFLGQGSLPLNAQPFKYNTLENVLTQGHSQSIE